MHSHTPNFTIIVNWKQKGFGCSKVCSYCNWRTSPLLPHGAQSEQAISNFIKQCNKSFITISGGGDPLYRFEENRHDLERMASIIKAHGFKVRVITREVQHVAQLRGIADYVSISLDQEIFTEIDRYKDQWLGMDIEYSLVLPSLPEQELNALKPQYMGIRSKLGGRLALRENFNSVHSINPACMSFGHSGIVFVPKKLCLESRYLSKVEGNGYSIVQDHAALAHRLMHHSHIYIFGGFAKHLVSPTNHLEYDDIDIIATDSSVLTSLTEEFAYTFKETSPAGSYPRYFIGTSTRAGKSIQLILMANAYDAHTFIFNAQYALDRFGYNQGFFFDPSVGEQTIRNAVIHKTAHSIPGPRAMHLFSTDRSQIESRHKLKLIKKGYSVIEFAPSVSV